MAKEHRQIARNLPNAALLGEVLNANNLEKHLPDFYQYFNLTNNQLFLRKIGRISDQTWTFCVDGIQTNIARPVFAHSWSDISRRSASDFCELRRLVADDFKTDPRAW